MGYILERVDNDSTFNESSEIKRVFIFPDSAEHPRWEMLAKEDRRALFVHRLFFSYKPFPGALLHMSAAAADQNFDLALAMGWGYIDSTISPGRNYFYRR